MRVPESIIIITLSIISFNIIIEANGVEKNCNCKKLEKQSSQIRRKLLIFGKPRNLTIYYGPRSPNRASAAMLFLIMKHLIGYDDIYLKRGPRTLCELAGSVNNLGTSDEDYNELIVHLGAEYSEEDDRRHCPELKKCDGLRDVCSAAGTRFEVMVPPLAPMTLFLQIKLSINAWNKSACKDFNSWIFYNNTENLKHCGFRNSSNDVIDHAERLFQSSLSNKSFINPQDSFPVYVQDYEEKHLKNLVDALSLRMQHQNLLLHIVSLPEPDLRNMISNTESSIIFLDYDLWTEDPQNRVRLVQLPPCVNTNCHHEFDKSEALVVGDASQLRARARLLFDIITIFVLPPKNILQILQAEAKGKDIIEAACDQVCEDPDNFIKWPKQLKERYLWVNVVLCDDPDIKEYNRMIKIFGKHQSYQREQFGIETTSRSINCSDLNNLAKNLMTNVCNRGYERMIGMVGAGSGAAAAAYNARMMETQLVLYDTPPDNTELNPAARTVASNLKSLAHVTQHFLKTKGWKRIAVLSDSYQISTDFLKLIRQSNLSIGSRTLKMFNRTHVTYILKKFCDERAKIFLINTNSEAASTILCTIVKLGLVSSDYVWIVREWREPSCDLGSLKYYTISYWWRGGKFPDMPDVNGNATIRRWLDELWPDRPWPRLASPLFDSLILLTTATRATVHNNISIRYDLHGDQSSRRITESLDKENVVGVVQELRTQKNYMLEAALVFIDEWQNATRVPVAVWRINSSNLAIQELKTLKQIWLTEIDGTYSCWFFEPEDNFNAKCKDWPIMIALIVIALIPMVTYLARKWRLMHLAARERDIHINLLARCERTATVLAGHLVPRSSLILEYELGKGHFGIVRLGRLKIPNRATTPVAVKELRNDAVLADEAVFLREGCVMAALSHPNIIQLVGVCAADGPPLLLMEYAFFRDLQKYLRERRLLIDITSDNDLENETAYVSAPELTRLAREAASALEYIAQMRYVHRDIRAANCVVTQQRTLKLADFGMARSTKHEREQEEDDYNYICCHKGVFPIMAMAPENLTSGVFTTASDVWSLGVLMLEIATLGATPYGGWVAPRIYNHVKEDGHPPFPIDASNQTRTILEMCWRSTPETRPTPTAIKKYLLENPKAIAIALIPALIDRFDGESEPDSGFKERDNFDEPQTP